MSRNGYVQVWGSFLKSKRYVLRHFFWQKYIHNDVPKAFWIMTWEPHIENGRLKISSTLKPKSYKNMQNPTTRPYPRHLPRLWYEREVSLSCTSLHFLICHSSLTCSLINIIYLFSCHTVISFQMKKFLLQEIKMGILRHFSL